MLLALSSPHSAEQEQSSSALVVQAHWECSSGGREMRIVGLSSAPYSQYRPELSGPFSGIGPWPRKKKPTVLEACIASDTSTKASRQANAAGAIRLVVACPYGLFLYRSVFVGAGERPA
mmetsp:Transcript_106068/g.282372  ORF Transcript_106068/g.282372 Transcript_106068/m.282372 type:complete len:119 (+) Transcript_106068:260-616(+)